MPAPRQTSYSTVFHLMDPELRTIIESQKQPDRLIRPTKSNVHKLRPAFDASSARWQRSTIISQTLEKCRAEQPWTESLIEIDCRDSYRMKAEVYTPCIKQQASATTPEDGLPIMLLVHGGGVCMGGLGTDRFIGQLLCSRVGMVVVSIEYRLFPDVEFQRPIWDVYDAMSWVQQNAGQVGSGIEKANLHKGFIACGPSAGGNLLSSAIYLAAEKLQEAEDRLEDAARQVPRLDGVIMLMTGFPVEAVDEKNDVKLDLYPDLRPSWKDLEEAPIMNRHVNPSYLELAPGQDASSPMFSILNVKGTSPVLAHFPKMWYHQIAGLDMWHDTALSQLGLLLHGQPKPLKRASMEHMPSLRGRSQVKVDHYPGLPHTWWSVYPEVSRTKIWIEDLVAGARWTLSIKNVSSNNSTQSDKTAKL